MFLELTENCRSAGDAVLARIQHALREGPDKIDPDDWEILSHRVCSKHCLSETVVHFQDGQELRGQNGIMQVVSQAVHHCPNTQHTRRNKCDAVIKDWANEKIKSGIDVRWASSRDETARGHNATDSAVAALDRSLWGLRSRVPVYIGMGVILTVNKNGFNNGTLGTVTNITFDPHDDSVIRSH